MKVRGTPGGEKGTSISSTMYVYRPEGQVTPQSHCHWTSVGTVPNYKNIIHNMNCATGISIITVKITISGGILSPGCETDTPGWMVTTAGGGALENWAGIRFCNFFN